MKKSLLVFALLLYLPAGLLLNAQTAELYIESAQGVYVFVDDAYKGYGNDHGKIRIADIEPGIHTVKFYKTGGIHFEEEVNLEAGMVYVYEEPFSPLSGMQPKRELTRVEVPPPPPVQVFEMLEFVETDVMMEDIEFGLASDDEASWDFLDEEIEEESEEVFFIVEDMPQFNGGPSDNFRQYIANNLQYPQIAAENNIDGRVYVQFTVDRTGKVTDVVVARGVDPALDKEAVRVVKSSPLWRPGYQRGRPVNVRFTFPIVFVLQ